MNESEIQSVVEARYNRANWQKLLYGIFGTRTQFFASPTSIAVEKTIADEAVYLGKITLPDDHEIAVYEVHLSEHVNIERNRAGIRNLLCSQWRGIFTGAFMLCYRNSESVLRFSYVSEAWCFDESGKYTKDATDPKRFTYLLGEGHRSRTAVQQFKELMNSDLTLKDVTKAFSVEALSKRFFNEYKEKYEDIVEYVTGKRVVKSGSKWEMQTTATPNKKIMAQFAIFADPEKAVRDYVKKLMGRLVFIQFLQKKGWMGVPASDTAWKNGDKDFVQNLFKNTENKDAFIDDVLEPLFEDLNTKRENDLVSSKMVGKEIKVPYLNGGLFEKDEQDNMVFPLPARFMQNLLDFFTQYNFTIDENDPDDAEVGVDPEMLSCIFENLLEDNNEKGAYYTPKEIVNYMCRESLIAYLCNGVKKNETKARVRDFVLTHKVDVLNAEENISGLVDEKLKNVKICDPAIGSGAFPMGLMRELYFCRSAIEGFDHEKAAEIKKHIIQQNIYGVDIEKGAVDIARLRFWLSLIVDEENPHALPNLDFKIMQGNSLLEQYEGVDLSDITYNATRKEKLSGKLLDLFDSGEVANKKIISLLKDSFFSCEDHDTKSQIRDALKNEMQSLLQTKACSVKLDAIKDVSATDQFFLWHTWFSEVFEKGGFDIVIGNPPYFQMKKGMVNREKFPFSEGKDSGKQNIYKLFVELSYNLLKENGIGSLITQSSLMCDASAQFTRELLLRYTTLYHVIEFPKIAPHPEGQLFKDVLVATCIILYRKSNAGENHRFSLSANNDLTTLDKFDFAELKQSDPISFYPNGFCLPLIRRNDFSIIQKMNTQTTFLSEYILESSQGDFNLTTEKFCYNGTVSDVKMYRGNKIHRYWIDGNVQEYIQNNYKIERINSNQENKWLVCQNISGMTDRNRFNVALTTGDRCLYGHTVDKVLLNANANPKVILGLLNSKAIDWYFRKTSTNNHVNIYELEQLPIPSISEEQQQGIVDVVDQIIIAKNLNSQVDITDLERRINERVYALYDLNTDEISVIEGTDNV